MVFIIIITTGNIMYVKINTCQYNLISLFFVLDSAFEYYLDYYDEYDSKESKHKKYRYLIEIINNNEIGDYTALIADEIEFLSMLALKRPYDNNDIVTLISILNGYLNVVRYGDSLSEVFSEFDYLNVKRFDYMDYREDRTSDSDDEQPEADIYSSTEEVEKDFFQEPFQEPKLETDINDFDFSEDNETVQSSGTLKKIFGKVIGKD